jgi:hypothetical protein
MQHAPLHIFLFERLTYFSCHQTMSPTLWLLILDCLDNYFRIKVLGDLKHISLTFLIWHIFATHMVIEI